MSFIAMRRTIIKKYPKSKPEPFPTWMYRGVLLTAALLGLAVIVALSDGSDRQSEDNSPYQVVPTPRLN